MLRPGAPVAIDGCGNGQMSTSMALCGEGGSSELREVTICDCKDGVHCLARLEFALLLWSLLTFGLRQRPGPALPARPAAIDEASRKLREEPDEKIQNGNGGVVKALAKAITAVTCLWLANRFW